MAARQILETCIEQGLRDTLGQSGFEMVSRLHPVHSSAEDPRRLHELLVGIFREKGALMIESKIASLLLDKLGDGDRPDVERSRTARQSRNSDYEAGLIRRFTETARLPGASSKHNSMESTAASFADAFTKGM
jgi:hypothetical protein